MNVMHRYVLRRLAIGALSIAGLQSVSMFDSAHGTALELAMGPLSATQEGGGAPTTADRPVTTCRSSEGPSPKHHHHSKCRGSPQKGE
jgi:hypothetical protein